jgi:hypothetical protein
VALGALLWLACPSRASAQKAAYLVQSKTDVDGDGKVDEVRIDDMGTISVDIAGRLQDGAWTALAATGKLIGGSLKVDRSLDPKGRTLIVASSKLRTGGPRTYEETVILAWSPGKLTTLWRGPVGAVGNDGAKYVSIELGRFGLIKYASREGVSRCDGETAHLDAERYDFASGSFRGVRQAVRVAPSPTTPTLQASTTPKDARYAAASGFWFRAASASSSMEASSAADLVAPLALSDGDDKTAWVERKGGFGRGEFVTLKSSVGPVHVKALRLMLGHGGAQADYNRPKRLALLLGTTHKYWIQINKDPKAPQWIALPESVPSDCVSLVIDDVYPQSASKANQGRTAISEITIVSDEDLTPELAGSLLASRIAAGKGTADLGRLLAAWGAAAAPALQKASQESKDPKARLRLQLALARIPAGADEVALALVSEGARRSQYRQLHTGLVAMQIASLPPLQVALESGKLSNAASDRVIAVLTAIALPEATAALVQALGKGSAAQRGRLVRALAQDPTRAPALVQALAASPAGPRQADLFQAASLAIANLAAEAPERIAFVATLGAALADADGALGYETQYQVVQAAARLGGEALVASLLQSLALPPVENDGQAIALYELRVAALARIAARRESRPASPAIVEALQAALTSENPGVRLALLNHLGGNPSLLAAQSQRLLQDTWPEVRRALAASLADNCDNQGVALALSQATRQDEDEAVARTSLTALLQCRGPALFELLLALIDDKTRPLGVRLYAARHAGVIGAPGSAGEVLKRFKNARTYALTDRSQGKLASALTVSLAGLGSSDAVGLLEDSALDPAVPDLQAAAVTALAKLCRPSSKPVLRQLKKSSNPAVARAARRASGRCH